MSKKALFAIGAVVIILCTASYLAGTAPPDTTPLPTTTASTKADSTETPEWDIVRAAIVVPGNCYGNTLEYCVTDRDFVDSAIQNALDAWYGGMMPTDTKKIQEIIASSKNRYTEALQTPDGLRRIESLVERRFNNPLITKTDLAVTYDLGHLPGKLGLYKFRIWPGNDRREWNGWWKGTEAAAALHTAITANPETQNILLKIMIPSPNSAGPAWTYLYNKLTDRLVVFNQESVNGAWVSDPLGNNFAPYISGEKSLNETLRFDRLYQVRNKSSF